jgi:glutathione synthase/RimK-type ligase-like ATP-grasp enzyme
MSKQKLPKLGFLYLDYVLRFFNSSNFKGWPDKIEEVVYHWKNDKARFIKEVKRKKIDILIGNIPATAYETFKEIAAELPHVRFVPSVETQFCNKSKENVTLFCEKYDISAPDTKIFYDVKQGMDFLNKCSYPKIVKRSYGPSNYGGYFVHKVDDKKEAIDLFTQKKYNPMYIQDCIPIIGDLRVMLIGHKPVCAFWRYSGEGEWITNTSQGGHMSYENVPIGALELAVEASKAAKAEYWACDIVENEGNYYILECATAFAAFSYMRDWIGQYLMWDFSNGRFRKPTIPLYSWEELGKMDSNFLKRMRHIEFSQFAPSTDGAFYVDEADGDYPMELTELTGLSDIPENPYLLDPKETLKPIMDEEDLPQVVQDEAVIGDKQDTLSDDLFDITNVTLTELLSLYGMEEEMAVSIREQIEAGNLKKFIDLSNFSFIEQNHIKIWEKSFKA